MSSKRTNDQLPKVSLSTPWDTTCQNVSVGIGGVMCTQSDEGKMSYETFIIERSRVHETYIREQAKTRRLSLILTAVMVLAAFAVVLFAPAGRESLSYWLGATLLLFAGGAAGYGKVWAKTKVIAGGAGDKQKF